MVSVRLQNGLEIFEGPKTKTNRKINRNYPKFAYFVDLKLTKLT